MRNILAQQVFLNAHRSNFDAQMHFAFPWHFSAMATETVMMGLMKKLARRWFVQERNLCAQKALQVENQNASTNRSCVMENKTVKTELMNCPLVVCISLYKYSLKSLFAPSKSYFMIHKSNQNVLQRRISVAL